MRALTIQQPWVGAIFTLGKNIENRSWSTSYRGPLVIHAGARRSTTPDAARLQERICMRAVACPEAWSLGHIVGVVDLEDCVRDSRSKWAYKDAWHWVLRNPRMLPQPLPCKGRLGLWTLAEDTEHLVTLNLKRRR